MMISFTDVVPLFQTLAWIIFVAILILLLRKQVLSLTQIIAFRLEQGASFKAGPLELGGTVKEQDVVEDFSSPIERARSTYLVHAINWHSWPNGATTNQIIVWISCIDLQTLRKIKKVVYHLPKSMPDYIRTNEDATSFFKTEITSVGEFVIGAEIYFFDEKEPVRTSRYINFYIPALYPSRPPVPPPPPVPPLPPERQ